MTSRKALGLALVGALLMDISCSSSKSHATPPLDAVWSCCADLGFLIGTTSACYCEEQTQGYRSECSPSVTSCAAAATSADAGSSAPRAIACCAASQQQNHWLCECWESAGECATQAPAGSQSVSGCPPGTGLAPQGNNALGSDCASTVDCSEPLMCAFGRCHTHCLVAQDCNAPERCTLTRGFGVCLFEPETRCQLSSDCPVGLGCASDGQCRTPCLSNSACQPTVYSDLNQLCADGFCADPAELVGGHLPGAGPDL